MIDEARGDVDDVSAALLRHVTDDALREVKEAIQVHGGHRGEVVVDVVQEHAMRERPAHRVGRTGRRGDRFRPWRTLAATYLYRTLTA